MCGLLYLQQPTALGIDSDAAAAALQRQHWRGPDATQLLTLHEGRVHIGHNRLAIVDPDSRSDQPMRSADGRYVIVFNGEIYNHRELKARHGLATRTTSDTEVLLAGYAQLGEGFLRELEGMYAFVIHDTHTQAWVAARDALGIKPLYLHRGAGLTAFASEPAVLASLVGASVDAESVAEWRLIRRPVPGRSFFHGVHEVLPGQLLRSDGSSAALWQLAQQHERFDAEAFEALLITVAQEHERSDVSNVALLSGGIDSAVILALTDTRKAYTVGLTAHNEFSAAADTASALKRELDTVDLSAQALVESWRLLTRLRGEPLSVPNEGLIYTVCAAMTPAEKVVLTGEGADGGFAGYFWFKIREAARLLDIGDAFRPSTAISRVARKWAAPSVSFGEFARIDGLIGGPHAQSILYNLVATARTRYYSDGMREELGAHVAYEDLGLDLDRMRRWHPLNRSLYLGYKVQLAGLLLSQKGDRVAMANSVETRYPFLDENVIALASRLHPRFKLRGLLKDKYLLRQAAARVLPKSVAERPKLMFRAPHAETFLAHPPAFVRDLLSPESLAQTGYFDATAVAQDCAALARGEDKKDLGTFTSLGLGGVVATQLWHHLYLGGGLCDLPEVNSGATPAAARAVA